MLSPIVTTCRKCTTLQFKAFPTRKASSSWKFFFFLFRIDSHWDKRKSKLHPCAVYQPTTWPGRGSHKKMFILIRTLVFRAPLLPRQVQSTPLSASSTQYMWELLAGNCWEGGSAFMSTCAPVNPIRQTGQAVGWLTCVTCFKVCLVSHWMLAVMSKKTCFVQQFLLRRLKIQVCGTGAQHSSLSMGRRWCHEVGPILLLLIRI